MSDFNYDFITTNLDRLWSFKISKDGKTALIGFGDDEGQLAQFDIEEKEVSKSYWTEGSYTLSIEFLSNFKAIIGTNNGFVMSIDLKKKVFLNKNKISNNSIKDLKLSDDKTLMFSITSSEILAFDINTLELIYKRELDFNPWYMTTIKDKNLIAIGGSTNKIELSNSKNLEIIDSVICGEEYRDVSSLIYDNKNSLLISGTESGTLAMWKVSIDGFKKEKEFKIEDNIYWLQNTDEYIAFSTSSKDIILYWFTEQKLLTLPNALGEARFSLKIIQDETYLLFQQKNKNLSLNNLTKRKIDFFNLTDLPYGVKFIDFTQNGDIVAVTSEGIIVSNFIKKEKVTKTKYDFNSKEKNIAVKEFIFNEVDESIVLQCKDETIKVISLYNAAISNIDFSFQDTYGLEIKDFYKQNILLSDYKDIYIINTQTNFIQEIINQDENFISIKNIKLINENKYAILNRSDYIATPIVWDYLKIYDFEGYETSSQKLDNIFSSMFISNDKLVTTYINSTFNSSSDYKPSKIINFNTNEVKEFDIAYCFEESDGTILFDNEKYAIRIAIGLHSNYYITCYNLMEKDENRDAKAIWENEAPWLSSFRPLGYCQVDGYFYIVNNTEGEIISLDINNGNMISSYQIQKSIEDIKMSNSGKYIAWSLKTGEFSYISYPFKSCEVSDE